MNKNIVVDQEALEHYIRQILHNAIKEDWIWTGEDEIKTENINVGQATKDLIGLFKEFGVCML